MDKPDGLSVYARLFDETNSEWKNNVEHNRMFLEEQERWVNHKLRRDGFVFLNEVYQALGFERTSIGQITGWLVNPQEGDGYIDFGLFEQRNKEDSPNFWLDFNVDGIIYDKIEPKE